MKCGMGELRKSKNLKWEEEKQEARMKEMESM